MVDTMKWRFSLFHCSRLLEIAITCPAVQCFSLAASNRIENAKGHDMTIDHCEQRFSEMVRKRTALLAMSIAQVARVACAAAAHNTHVHEIIYKVYNIDNGWQGWNRWRERERESGKCPTNANRNRNETLSHAMGRFASMRIDWATSFVTKRLKQDLPIFAAWVFWYTWKRTTSAYTVLHSHTILILVGIICLDIISRDPREKLT